jgi:hypothetical protein
MGQRLAGPGAAAQVRDHRALEQTVPVRRERVAEEVRKEQIDVDEDTTGGRHERRRRR